MRFYLIFLTAALGAGCNNPGPLALTSEQVEDHAKIAAERAYFAKIRGEGGEITCVLRASQTEFSNATLRYHYVEAVHALERGDHEAAKSQLERMLEFQRWSVFEIDDKDDLLTRARGMLSVLEDSPADDG